MPEYPDNSHSARENTSPPSKRVEKVVNGTAKTRKQSEVKKFAGIFMPDEVGDVKTFIITDVVIPGLKNAIADVVSIVLFGEAGLIGTQKNAGSKVSYQRYYDDPRRDDRRNYNPRPRPVSGFEFDDIIFDNRGDADLVLDQLESAIANYGMASVLDLYDLAGLTCQNYMADKYGWTDIQSARVARTRDGYILQLPRAIQIT